MGKHRRKEKIQQKDQKPAHITGTMTVFEYVHELLAGECSLGCGCTCFFANVHNLSNKTKFCWLMKQKWASVKMIERAPCEAKSHHVSRHNVSSFKHSGNSVMASSTSWTVTQKYINDSIVLKNSLFSPYLCHGFKRFSYSYFWRRQLKNAHESLTKCSDRQNNPVNIRLVQIEIPCSLELLQWRDYWINGLVQLLSQLYIK